MRVPEYIRANQLMAGKICAYCQYEIKLGDRVARCLDCKALMHEECWNENKGCTSYGCPSAAAGAVDETYISSKEIEEAVEPEKRLSFTALISVLFAMVGLVLIESIGSYIGVVALFAGFVGFMNVRKQPSLKGEILAVLGMVLGAFDLILGLIKSGIFK